MKNCRDLSTPFEIIYLLADTNGEHNCSLEWFYKEKSYNTFKSANDVRELDTPNHIFISIKHFLDYNKVYSFKVKGLEYCIV